MTKHIGVGATTSEGARFPSKKALREALAADPESVRFRGTSPFEPMFTTGALFDGVGIALSVVGPDPERDRRWYATITRTPKGLKVA